MRVTVSRNVLDRATYRLQITAALIGQTGLALEQRLRVQRDRRDRVVDVVSDAARHLSEHAQSLLLHHGLLRPAQLLVRFLERPVKLRLMRGQRDMLAQLAQELAFAAAEGRRLATRCDQHTEDATLAQQWRRDHRFQAGAHQAPRKREGHHRQIRFMDQTSAHAARQAVLIDLDASLFRQGEPRRERRVARSDARHRQTVVRYGVQAQTREVEGQLFLDTAHDDLKDAAQVLVLADRARDLTQEPQSRELSLQSFLGKYAPGDVAVVRDDRTDRGVVEQVGRNPLEPDPHPVLMAPSPEHGDRPAGVRDEFLHGFTDPRNIVWVRVLEGRTPDQLVGVVAFHRSDRRTQVPDLSGCIHKCEAVAAVLDQRPEATLVALQRLVGPRELGRPRGDARFKLVLCLSQQRVVRSLLRYVPGGRIHEPVRLRHRAP